MTARFPDPNVSFLLWAWVVIGFLLCAANTIGAVSGYSVPCDDAAPLLCSGGSLGRGAFIASSVFAFFLGFVPLVALTGWPKWFLQFVEKIA